MGWEWEGKRWGGLMADEQCEGLDVRQLKTRKFWFFGRYDVDYMKKHKIHEQNGSR